MEWKDYLYGYDDGFRDSNALRNNGCNPLFSVIDLIISLLLFMVKLLFLLLRTFFQLVKSILKWILRSLR